MPRYIVKYTKPGQIEGARVFDLPGNADADVIRRAAQATAGHNATVVEVHLNDGGPLFETEPKQ